LYFFKLININRVSPYSLYILFINLLPPGQRAAGAIMKNICEHH